MNYTYQICCLDFVTEKPTSLIQDGSIEADDYKTALTHARKELNKIRAWHRKHPSFPLEKHVLTFLGTDEELYQQQKRDGHI